MTREKLDVFERALQKADSWIDDLASSLGWEDRHRTYEALGSVLHVLRDRLPVRKAVDLGAQLPLLIRGLYYQSWDVSVSPEKYRHADDFLRHIRGQLTQRRLDPIPEERLVESVASLMADRLSVGELECVCRSLPPEIREFFLKSGSAGLDSRSPSSRRWYDEERAWDQSSP